MLKDILKIIIRDGYISRSLIARELNIPEEIIDDGIKQLIRMEYILEESTGEDCSTFCASCQFAKNCSKEVITSFQISHKGNKILQK